MRNNKNRLCFKMAIRKVGEVAGESLCKGLEVCTGKYGRRVRVESTAMRNMRSYYTSAEAKKRKPLRTPFLFSIFRLVSLT